MCMTKVDFALEYNKPMRCLVGIGYKKLAAGDKPSKYRRWVKCTGDTAYYYNPEDFDSKRRPIYDANGQDKYLPGFHLFTTEAAARKYPNHGKVCKFYYRLPIAFGTNVTGSYPSSINEPCVIAKEMKLAEVLPD